jgi:hypothetical protein
MVRTVFLKKKEKPVEFPFAFAGAALKFQVPNNKNGR